MPRKSGEKASRRARKQPKRVELEGKLVVFTGALELPRGELESLVENLGASVGNSVTKKTDYLVVGRQNSPHLKGGKSGKERKAEAYGIPIIQAEDFYASVGISPAPESPRLEAHDRAGGVSVEVQISPEFQEELRIILRELPPVLEAIEDRLERLEAEIFGE